MHQAWKIGEVSSGRAAIGEIEISRMLTTIHPLGVEGQLTGQAARGRRPSSGFCAERAEGGRTPKFRSARRSGAGGAAALAAEPTTAGARGRGGRAFQLG